MRTPSERTDQKISTIHATVRAQITAHGLLQGRQQKPSAGYQTERICVSVIVVRAVCCEGVTAAGYTLSLPLCLDLDFASFLQFEHAVVET